MDEQHERRELRPAVVRRQLRDARHLEEDRRAARVVPEEGDVVRRASVPAEVAVGRAVGLRRQMNIELNFPPNFERLVLGCIDADFCK